MTKKSELKLCNSKFTLNRASSGGSVAVVKGHSFIESCNFTSDTASNAGGCITFHAANGIMKQSELSECQSKSRGAVVVTEQGTLLLEAVTIKQSYSTRHGHILSVSYNSDLLMKKTVITDSRSGNISGGIYCSEKSQMHLDSVLMSSCYSHYHYLGWVGTSSCNITMNNITMTGASLLAHNSTINIYNTMVQNDEVQFLKSHVSFWNVNISTTCIELDESVTEFRHTLLSTQDEMCSIRDEFRSTIKFKSLYITHPKKKAMCHWTRTVVRGIVSGMIFNFTLISFIMKLIKSLY